MLGGIVAVTNATNGGSIVSIIDKIHWGTDPFWISLIDVNTGEWRSAQLQHVVGKLENCEPALLATPEPAIAVRQFDDPPSIEMMFAVIAD